MDLRNHIGMHVEVDLEGMTVGGVECPAGPWVPGVIIGLSAMASFLSIQLDTPIGGGTPHGLLHRVGHGQDLVSVDPDRVRPSASAQLTSATVPDDIVALARAGKTVEAIKRYRALNGATVDEARAVITKL
jgi:hypothetical protein